MGTQKQVEMPSWCGGDEPGLWLDMGNGDDSNNGGDDADNDGVDSAPIITSLIVWWVVRLITLYVDYCLQFYKFCFPDMNLLVYNAIKCLLFTVNRFSIPFLIAPLENLATH